MAIDQAKLTKVRADIDTALGIKMGHMPTQPTARQIAWALQVVIDALGDGLLDGDELLAGAPTENHPAHPSKSKAAAKS